MKINTTFKFLALPILNLLILMFFLEVNESLIITPILLAILYIYYFIKTSKKYKNRGLNLLFILSYLAILFFPTIHYISYKINENNYYLSDYLKDSANHRLENEKKDKQYSTLNFDIIKNSLISENNSTLNKSEFFKLKQLVYLDSIRLSGVTFEAISDSTYNYKKYSDLGGGGIKPAEIYLTIFKNNNKINIIYSKNRTIRNTLESYLNGYNSFYERTNDVKKEIGFVDFWLASISSFKFSEIIPNTYLTKSLWLIQSIISFILLFYISANFPQLTINKKTKN
ncbi:hypothetical protein [uncultured Winogradskyella sp.]|uniref:hypothetical protein n=1 Tax=uncultured Winogradskyella sp. TaxID=395353 RepID=UPI00261B3B61|nr:hypothetical protein [uncultured Winogradskyella sp.]